MSDYQIRPTARFYLRFPDSWDEAHASYFDGVATSIDNTETWGFADLIADMTNRIDTTIAEPGSPRTIDLEVAAPTGRRAELPVIVGLENKLWAYTDDVSYDVTFASSWTLDAAEFRAL